MTQEQYVKSVKRALSLPGKMKQVVLAGLNETFEAAKEHGENESDIISRLGEPAAFAEEIMQNADLSHKQRIFLKRKKSLCIGVVTLFGIALAVTGYIVQKAFFITNHTIGYADGPTAIFVISNSPDTVLILLFALLWLLPIGLLIYLLLMSKKVNK